MRTATRTRLFANLVVFLIAALPGSLTFAGGARTHVPRAALPEGNAPAASPWTPRLPISMTALGLSAGMPIIAPPLAATLLLAAPSLVIPSVLPPVETADAPILLAGQDSIAPARLTPTPPVKTEPLLIVRAQRLAAALDTHAPDTASLDAVQSSAHGGQAEIGKQISRTVTDKMDLLIAIKGRTFAVMTAKNFRILMARHPIPLDDETRFVLVEGRSGRFWELPGTGSLRLVSGETNPVSSSKSPRSYRDPAEPAPSPQPGNFGDNLSRQLTLQWNGNEFRLINNDARPPQIVLRDSPVDDSHEDWGSRIEKKLADLRTLFDQHINTPALDPLAHLRKLPPKGGRDVRIRFERVPGEVKTHSLAHYDPHGHEVVLGLRFASTPSLMLLAMLAHELQHAYDHLYYAITLLFDHHSSALISTHHEYRAHLAETRVARYILMLLHRTPQTFSNTLGTQEILQRLEELTAIASIDELKNFVDRKYQNLKSLSSIISWMGRCTRAAGLSPEERRKFEDTLLSLEFYDTLELAVTQPEVLLSRSNPTILRSLIEAVTQDPARLAQAVNDAEQLIAQGISAGRTLPRTAKIHDGGMSTPIGLAEAKETHDAGAAALAAYYRDKLSPQAAPLTSVRYARPGALAAGADSSDLPNYYQPQRAALQMRIIRRAFAHADLSLPPPGRKPVAVLQGGNPASGKSHSGRAALVGENSPFGADAMSDLFRRAVPIDPDAYKKSLPEYNGANASLMHTETADMALYTFKKAVAERRNVLLDGSMGNLPYVLEQIRLLQAAGYEIEIVGSLLPNDKAIGRAATRTLERGRFIPFDFVARIESNRNLLQIAAEREQLGIKRVRLYGSDVPKGADPVLLYDSADEGR